MKSSLYPIKNAAPAELKIETLEHAFVTRSMLAGTIRGVSPFALPLPPDSPRRKEFNKVYFLSFLKNGVQRLPDEDLYFVFNLWGTGYHHFLTEIAIKFPLFERQLRAGQILLPPDSPPFVRDFLKLTGFENLIFMKRNGYAKRLKIITNPISGFFDRNHLLKLQEFVFKRTGFAKNVGFDKIYISRRNARARKVLNEDELIDVLRKKDFQCLDADKMSLAEQINIFRQCRRLISIHGAALTNAVFMPENSRVYELYPKQATEDSFNLCYSRLGAALRQRHEYIFCDRENQSTSPMLDTDNIRVDVDEVIKLVSRND